MSSSVSTPLSLLSSFLLVYSVICLEFNISRFDPAANDILYEGDAKPMVGAVDMTSQLYFCHVGRVTYNEKVRLWDSGSGKLSDFTTHFQFTIDTNGQSHGHYAAGFAFFMAPVGFQIPVNSIGGFLGLYNTTNSDSSQNQIVHVEFDSFANPEWDPNYEHVGINTKSIASAVTTPWNVTYHSGDTVDAWINYNASTMNLSASWSFQTTPNPQENTSLSYQIDLRTVLPEWVIIGFSAASGYYMERHTLGSWDFKSSLAMEGPNSGNSKRVGLILGLTIPLSVMVASGVAIAMGIIWMRRKRKNTEKITETATLTSINDDFERRAGPRRFSYQDLASATNNFSSDRKLGEGGFGAVYRGYLLNLDTMIAVKRISRGSKQGKREFVTEVKVISSLRHRNLVQLIGWCHEGNEFMLVYEYMPNGSLDLHLFGKKSPLNWSIRYRISIGLASAIFYLHEEWEQCVIHRDIKSSNVMLDSNFNVKLGDFGLARLMDHELGPQTTGLAGTFGYLAPEYMTTGRASKESDVYSFGVVALEIATGKRARDPKSPESEMSLVEWVWALFGDKKLPEAVDERMGSDLEETQVECLIMVGLWCAHPDQTLRPSIRQAIQVLKFEADVPNLPVKMPVPVYRVPTPSVSSGEPLLTSIIEEGR
ncbi:L-type lectin-domain containing receptor kinase IX.1 [Eucalyptus grandis]|uniref:L-type lectin-domain containing receptor kinase IX.1 n=1 Tax=Eucalyptus grandis TaxID=71139 RepID=UPI00192E9227|nr:L-type lectin-domain containing receptor kinase IX.1 [Eucalyptus grandis]